MPEKENKYFPVYILRSLEFLTSDYLINGDGSHMFLVLENTIKFRSILSVEFGNELITICEYKFDWQRNKCSRAFYVRDFNVKYDHELMFLLNHLPPFVFPAEKCIYTEEERHKRYQKLQERQFKLELAGAYEPYEWEIKNQPDNYSYWKAIFEGSSPPSRKQTIFETIKNFFTKP